MTDTNEIKMRGDTEYDSDIILNIRGDVIAEVEHGEWTIPHYHLTQFLKGLRIKINGEIVAAYRPKQVGDEMVEILRRCKEDLKAEYEARYPLKLREQYPSVQKGYNRDMSVVYEAEKIITTIKGE